MAELSIEAENRTLPITARWVRIGRDPANQIVLLDDLFVSRYHAWVTFEQDKFWLEDLGSTNGTLLNEQPVQKRILLTSGDKIKIGETDITFRLLNDNK
ncbi:MAG: FHA domain-containing protein [Candidatus Obscuribacterales bacterium]